MPKISDLPNLTPYYNSLSSVQFVANCVEQEGGDYITGRLEGEQIPSLLLSSVTYYNYLDADSYFLYKASYDDNSIHGIKPQGFIDTWLYYDSPQSVSSDTNIIIDWSGGGDSARLFSKITVDSLVEYIKSKL